MTNTPRNIQPVSPEGDEEISREQQVKRPTAEKVSPSQQGQFLGALEKKTQKKAEKSTPETGEEVAPEEEEEPPVKELGLFHLAKAKAMKDEGSSTESSSEEGEEKEKGGKGKGPMPEVSAMPAAPMAPPGPTTASASKQPMAEPRAAAQAEKGIGMARPSPQEGVTPAPSEEGTEAFQKLMGKQREEEAPVPGRVVPGMVQPTMTPTQVGGPRKAESPQAAERQALFEVIRQATDAITTFVTKHEVRTMITIKHPPLFEGATLTITEYSSAPQQFNITFENLSPDAQRVVEAVANQQQLKQTLIERGYTIQNVFVIATPQQPTVAPLATAEPTREERRREESAGEEEGGKGGGFGGQGHGAR